MEQDLIKEALNMLPYGFYGISSRSGDDVNAMVATWITQISFDPRLLAFGLQKSSYSHSLISSGQAFVLHLFRTEDLDSIKPYTKSRSKYPEKLADIEYATAPLTGCPVLPGAAAILECRVRQILDVGGDHDVVISEPIGAQVFKPSEPADILTLVDIGWSYAG
jgi:flavin reductase (DIM6/NTAB) family NADH-FMN oxidoreductase RutF